MAMGWKRWRRQVGCTALALGLAAGTAGPLDAQVVAQIAMIDHVNKNLVQVRQASTTNWHPAREREGIQQNYGLRTERRGQARLDFVNSSHLFVDQLVELKVKGVDQLNVELIRGHRVFVDGRGRPCVVQSAKGVCITGGTRFEYSADLQEARIRCDEGVCYVFGAKWLGNYRAGIAASATATTLVDQGLRRETEPLAGSTLLVLTGPNRAQRRAITGFDSAAGRLTFAALQPAIEPGTRYAIIPRDEAPLILEAGMETVLRENAPPSPPHRALPPQYASGEHHRWYDSLAPGGAQKVYNGSLTHEQDQEDQWPLTEDPGPIYNPGGNVIVPGSGEFIIKSPRRSLRTRGAFSGDPAFGTPQPLADVHRPPPDNLTGVNGDLMPYAIGADPASTYGGYGRFRAMAGPLLVGLSGNVATFLGNERADIAEAFVQIRSDKWGDLKAGRQLLFVGPVNNSGFGRLVDFNATDAVLWRSPASLPVQVRLGYLGNIAPLRGDRFSGWLGRVNSRLLHGLVGATVLSYNSAESEVGYAADLSQPLIPDLLNIYVEGGRDPFRRTLATGGFYFPSLFRQTGVDAFLEYQYRQTLNDRVSLRLRTQVGHGMQILGYAIQNLRGGTDGGIGAGFRF